MYRETILTWGTSIAISLLALMSLVTLQSVTPELASTQFVFFLAGGLIFTATWYLHFTFFIKWRYLGYVGLVFLLIATFFLATITRGTNRWITIGSINIQISQLAVPLVSLVLADFLERYNINKLRNLLIFSMVGAIPAALIFIQPDLGTTLILALSIGAMLFSSKLSNSWIFSLSSLALLSIVLAWFFALAPYQKERLTSFFQPNEETADSRYNAEQSLIAVGSGQWIGRGLGQGVQSQLRFLPERHTDFIFASLAEEWGFLGASLVITAQSYLIGVMVYKAWHLEPGTSYYFLIATIVFFTFQVTVNIGMNMQLLPITGLTLPFVSYGGSSIFALFFHLGLVQSILLSKPPVKTHHFT